ncbi:MAG: B12-binding domain-containing radical SAM protein [Desulfobacula sp.]|nr:B12-binding domain-containing radical SAM protein [Desulfobacula sp.]
MSNNYFPLGLGYLAAATLAFGHEVHIYNAELETEPMPPVSNRSRLNNHNLFVKALKGDHRVWEEFRGILEQYTPDLVGFSCTSASIAPCLLMAADVKKICSATVVFGGMHPTLLPEETAKADNVDFVVSGEAERSFPALVEALANGMDPFSIPGIGGQDGTLFRFLQPEPPQKNINQLPLPNRDVLINFEQHRPWLYAMLASRGCPYQCTFCSGRHLTHGHVRQRSITAVVDEMIYLRDVYSMDYIVFYDDAMVLNKSRTMKLCQEMIDRQVGLQWSAFTRVDSADPELLSIMKKSGCNYLGLGIESGSDRILSLIKKGYTRDQAIRGVRLIQEAGIAVSGNIIVGFPFEREEDIMDSISLIKELDIPINVNTFTPYPGSELYLECQRRGLVSDHIDWTKISQHSPFNAFVDEITTDRYYELLDEIVAAADQAGRPAPTSKRSPGEIINVKKMDSNLLENSGMVVNALRSLKSIFTKK